MEKWHPKIMGILNVTPDSFYDGGMCNDKKKAVDKGIRLYHEGADIVDVGGESTRPGSEPISENEEYERVIPVIQALKNEIPVPISIDTVKPKIAEAALKVGASFLNDVSGFRNPDMVALAAQADVPICVMHMQGIPKSMQLNPHYEEGIILHLLRWFEKITLQLQQAGVKDKNIILDPGIGFGKTVDDNLKILHNLQKFKASGFPVLVGLSRKSFLSKMIDKPAKDTLAATIAMNTVALLGNADFIRVHDVAAHRDVVDVVKRFLHINKSDEINSNEAVSVIGSRF
jgi:dihydropteroate synthase